MSKSCYAHDVFLGFALTVGDQVEGFKADMCVDRRIFPLVAAASF
ncbi:hypothetical protein IWY39_003791 [Sphingobium sp. JAI105]|nr:hypothetical protein [Sphingobium sp. JAI105]TWD13931.1 hypothetical protein FB596_1871 [Sphingobium sp. AEW013]TWD18339.1 hypothetical protein FB594_1861 [Sphingobium sp. AEW001]MBG6118452.1 hypothetical protein [Sphingobium sp. JAI105]MBG6119024.1 hypothetical protein [Sphingobium sp. JAI105]